MVDPEADIIWGSAFNAELDGRIRVSVVATGIDTAQDAMAVETPAIAAPVVRPAPAPQPIRAPAPAAEIPALADLVDMATSLAVADEDMTEAELLLTAERALVLTPPDGAADVETLDPFAADPNVVVPIRGPSLFERMAMAARGAVRQAQAVDADAPPLPNLYRGRDWPEQRIARAA
jgi:cell division protein FtsZ